MDKENIYKKYMQWVEEVTEECEWKSTFTAKELVFKVCSLIEENSSKDFINFYEWIDDNYKRVSDGYVVKLSFDIINPIITVQKAFEEWKTLTEYTT